MNYSNTAVDTNFASSITDAETSKAVDSATGYPEAPFKILCEDEVILVGTKSGTTFSDMTRGFEGTTAAAHTTTPQVKHVGTSGDLEAIPYGSWVADLFRRPGTAHADDDEFNDDTKDAAWGELVVTGTTTWTEEGTRMLAEYTNQTGDDFNALYKSLGSLSHPLTIETCVRSTSEALTNFNMAGLFFSDGVVAGSNTAFAMPFGGTTPGHYTMSLRGGTFTAIGSVIGTDRAVSGFGSPIYLQLIWSAANNFKYRWSNNGQVWILHASGTKTMTPTHFGLGVTSYGTTAFDRIAAFEYFRVTESDLSL